MDAASISAWSNYFSAMAEVAATLTGLVFVAVSINLSRILTIPGLPGRAAESILHLMGAVIIATTALIPQQQQRTPGSRYLRSKTGHPRQWAVTRIVQTQFATAPFLISGVLLLRLSPAGLYWLAPGFVFSLLAGVANAWVLLVEILR